MVSQLKKWIESQFGLRILVVPKGHLPGISLTDDLNQQEDDIRLVFDVGAHQGFTVQEFLRGFPDSKVVAFEPEPENFRALREEVDSDRVVCEKCAVSNEEGAHHLNLSDHTTAHRLSDIECKEEAIRVPTTTVDTYCRQQGIDHIDLLKVDTEGHDLQVIKGARDMIENGCVSYILAEVSLNLEVNYFCSFEEIRRYLQPREFLPFAIYEQSLGWSNRTHHVFANALFTYEG